MDDKWNPFALPTLDSIQDEMIESVVAARRADKKAVIVRAATGVGKTYTAAKLIRRGIGEWGGRFLFLAHRRELVDQAAAEFASAGIPFAIEMADSHAKERMTGLFGDTRVVVASKDSMQGERLARWPVGSFTDIISDECHLATAKTWGNVYTYFSHEFHLGLSATPYRHDGTPLVGKPGAPFQEQVYSYPLVEAISNGHLCDIHAITCPVGVDLAGVRTTKSKDFNQGDLEDRISKAVEPLANAARQEMERLGITKAILFAPDVGSARAFADAFTLRLGIPAKAVHGENKQWPMSARERGNIIKDYRDGRFQVLTSCELLTLGFNDPPTQALIMARPTKSLGLFMQMVGRGTRNYPGKEMCYVIGYQWEGQEGIIGSLDMFMEDEDKYVRKRAKEIAKKRPDQTPKEIVEEAKEEVETQRQARAFRLQVKKRDVDYKRFEFRPYTATEMLGVPTAELGGGPKEKPTKVQLDFLKTQGMTKFSGITKASAEQFIDAILERLWRQEASPQEMVQLVRRGMKLEDVRMMSAKQAKEILARPEPATDKQRRYLMSQGCRVASDLTKRDAKRMIASLVTRR